LCSEFRYTRFSLLSLPPLTKLSVFHRCSTDEQFLIQRIQQFGCTKAISPEAPPSHPPSSSIFFLHMPQRPTPLLLPPQLPRLRAPNSIATLHQNATKTTLQRTGGLKQRSSRKMNKVDVFGAKPSPATFGDKISPSLTWTTTKPSCPAASWPVFKADRTDFPLYNGQCQVLGIARH
jgi:hypothetical protein